MIWSACVWCSWNFLNSGSGILNKSRSNIFFSQVLWKYEVLKTQICSASKQNVSNSFCFAFLHCVRAMPTCFLTCSLSPICSSVISWGSQHRLRRGASWCGSALCLILRALDMSALWPTCEDSCSAPVQIVAPELWNPTLGRMRRLLR